MATFVKPPGTPLSMSEVNAVFGRGTSMSNYAGTTYYTASGGPFTFPSSNLSFSAFYNTGPSPAGFATVSLSTVPSQSFAYYTTSTNINVYLIFNSNGTWVVNDDSGQINAGNWGSPTTPSGGDAYYIRFTLTQSTPLGTNNPFAPAGWNPLSFSQYCSTYVNFFDIQAQSATWTVDIATDSGGSNIIATRSGIQIFAVPGSPP
jgi:hypothetical protein